MEKKSKEKPRRTARRKVAKPPVPKHSGRARSTSAPSSSKAITGYTLTDDAFEQALLTGEHAPLLEDYLGEEQYRELRELAQKAASKRAERGPRVLILPGITGSKLGKDRPFILPDDVIWFDPIDIAAGKVFDLALDSGKKLKSLGVLLLGYLKLKLMLKIAGYDARFHDYDWRQSIDTLGDELARKIEADKAETLHLVAHSMGGLVARAAFARVKGKVDRLVMLGTPNSGSFAPVQTFRGVYSTLKKLAFLDLKHDAEEIAKEVMVTFPSLYQMLPTPEKFNAVNLYDVDAWPAQGPRPDQAELRQAIAVQQSFSPPHEKFYLIAGVNQETVTGVRRSEGSFSYEVSNEGDGTVPLMLAELPGVPTYYVEESHGSLPNNSTVADAVADILASGATNRLTTRWEPSRRGVLRTVSDKDLQEAEVYPRRRAGVLSQRETRELLRELVAPSAREVVMRPEGEAPRMAVPSAELDRRFESVVVGRRRQHRLDVELAHGDICAVNARTIVLGIFRDVIPTGAARAVDGYLEGAITEFTQRRLFGGHVGEIFMIPASRRSLRCENILFVGLGAFDDYSGEVQQIATENVIRTLVHSGIEEFATVLLGSSSGGGISSSLVNQISGLVRGLKDADQSHRFRRIILCELERERYEMIKAELLDLSSTSLFADLEITFNEVRLPTLAELPAVSRRIPTGPDPVYLVVRREGDPDAPRRRLPGAAQRSPQAGDTDMVHYYRSSVLGAGSKATVITGVRSITKTKLDAHLKKIEGSRFTFDGLKEFGNTLADYVLPDEIKAVLPTMQDRQVIIVHDADASRIPWETLYLQDWSPTHRSGVSRQYLADDLSVAKWLEERRQDAVLNMLLVVNPTEDLDGAEEEGRRIKEILNDHPSVQIDELRGPAATKIAVASALRSGKYDVIHYAGHAFFDPVSPQSSGIVCHGHQVLSGGEVAGIGNLPALVFFNACEAGRIRRGRAEREDPALDVSQRIERNVGLAEAFLRGGVANYVGTYWPVSDSPAKEFAKTFYIDLVKGKTIGDALKAAREAVYKLQSVDWADYIHYGNYNFVIKHE